MSKISSSEKIRNTNIYYHNIQNCVRPGAVLILMAHCVGESLLEACISSIKGSLIATTSATYSTLFAMGDWRKLLTPPINFDATSPRNAMP
jgi:hypothetical protein